MDKTVFLIYVLSFVYVIYGNERDARQDLTTDGPICRDDLCIAKSTPKVPDGTVTTTLRQSGSSTLGFTCPPKFKKVIRNGDEVCEPLSAETTTRGVPSADPGCQDGETLISTSSGPVCVPTKSDLSQPSCMPGHVPVQGNKGIICVEPDPYSINFCPLGHVRVDIGGQLKCYPILNVFGHHVPKDKIPSLKGKRKKKHKNRSNAKGKRKGKKGRRRDKTKTKNGRKVSKSSEFKGSKTAGLNIPSGNIPNCTSNKVPLLTDIGYTCVDTAFLNGVCPVDHVPQWTRDSFVCVRCPPGQIVVQTDSGPQCSPSATTKQPSTTSSTPATEITCPEGLVPLETAVGRVCQYIPPAEHKEEPHCPPGQRAVTRNGRVTCEQQRPRDCGPGQVMVETPSGEFVCGFENTLSESNYCPQGLVQAGDKCIYPTETSTTSPNSGPCPPGQTPHPTNSGIKCQNNHQTDQNSKGDHADHLFKTRCSKGNILTQMPKGFFCHTLEIPDTQVPECESTYVPARIGHTFGCITSYEADLICAGEEFMVRSEAGFVCRPGNVGNSIPCANGEVRSIDEFGAAMCISLEKATETCGHGYRAIPRGSGFLCKKIRLDLRCPDDFVLDLSAAVPKCVSSKEPDCEELPGGNCSPIGVDNELSPCEDGYEVDIGQTGLGCSLPPEDPNNLPVEFSQTFPGDFHDTLPVEYPDSTSWMRPNPRPDLPKSVQYLEKKPGDPQSVPAKYPVNPNMHHAGNPPISQPGSIPLLYPKPIHPGYHESAPQYHVDNLPEFPNHNVPVINPDERHVGYKKIVPFGKPGHATESQSPVNKPCEEVLIDGIVRPCDLDIRLLLDGCNPDCANGGTCVEGMCSCPPGVTGKACHIDVDECQTTERGSCQYECENTFGSFHCSCPHPLTLDSDGISCVDRGCNPECLNGGQCRDGQCRCPSGFEGSHCQTDKDECQLYGRKMCQHYCRNTYGGYECVCPQGSRLNTDRRTCTNTTCIPDCKNGGECENSKCICAAGYYGIICQFDVNECYKKQPCQHKCENTPGSYRCTCNHGYILHTDGHSCQRF